MTGSTPRRSQRSADLPRSSGDGPASPVAEGRPTHFVAGGEGFLDHSEAIVGLGLQLEDDAALAHALGLQDLVVLAATVNVSDRVAGPERLDRHEVADA